MIVAIEGTIRIDGDPNEVYAEAALILREIYQTVKEHTDEEYAMAKLNDIHEIAVLEEEEISRYAHKVM